MMQNIAFDAKHFIISRKKSVMNVVAVALAKRSLKCGCGYATLAAAVCVSKAVSLDVFVIGVNEVTKVCTEPTPEDRRQLGSDRLFRSCQRSRCLCSSHRTFKFPAANHSADPSQLFPKEP